VANFSIMANSRFEPLYVSIKKSKNRLGATTQNGPV
jgi:hypothetical protein